MREVEAGKPIAQAAREYRIHPTLIGRWRKEYLKHAERAFTGNENPYKGEARITELERMVGRLTMELEIAKKASLLLSSRWEGDGN